MILCCIRAILIKYDILYLILKLILLGYRKYNNWSHQKRNIFVVCIIGMIYIVRQIKT